MEQEITETALAAEESLSRFWLTKEENEAWEHLQEKEKK